MARVWRGAGGPRITKRRSKASTSAGGAGSAGSVARQQVGTQTLSPNLGPLLTDLLNSDVDHWLFNENHPIVGSAEANAAEHVHADSPNANMDRRGSPLHTDVSDRASLNAINPERNEDVDPDRRFRGINRCNVGEPVVDKLPLGILGGKLSPLDAIRHVTATLHLHWPGPFMSWAAVPPLSQGTIWTKFKLTYNVPLEKEELYRKAFDLVAADRYRSILSSARKEAAKVNGSDNPKDWVKHPDWMDEGDWKVLLNEWMSDAWQLKSTRNRKNRLTKKDGTIPTHSGGSVSFAEHRSRMAEELGREPTFEEWFANMHRNKKAPAEFVDNRAKRVLEEYKALKLAKYGTAENAARVDFDLALWKKACGGKTKGRLYGVGRYMYAMQGVSRAPMGEELLFTRSQLEAAVAEGINAARPRLISEVLAAVQGKDGVQGMQGVVSTSNEDGQPAVVQAASTSRRKQKRRDKSYSDLSFNTRSVEARAHTTKSAVKGSYTMKNTRPDPPKYRTIGTRRVMAGLQNSLNLTEECQLRKPITARVPNAMENTKKSTAIRKSHNRGSANGNDSACGGHLPNDQVVESEPHNEGLSRQIRNPPENNIPTVHESIDEVQYQHMTKFFMEHIAGESYIAPEPCARDTQTDLPGAVKMAKRVRGPTKMKQKGRRESWEPLIQLEFNEEGEVKSDNATTFANFCGVAVRKYAPLQLKVWEDVPFNSLELIFQKINKHYQIPNDRQVLDKLLKSLGKKYRAYRTRLKSQYFDVHKTNALRLSHRPKMINEEDWVYLVALFSSDEFQVASNRNENNRKKYKGSHRAGTSSFAKVESMMKRTEGASPGKYRLYEKTHKPANGDPMNVHSNEIMEKAAKVAKERGVDLDTAILNVLPSSKKKRKVLHFIPASCNSVSEEVIALQVGKERADNRAALAEKLALEAMHDAAVAKERARLMEINLAKAQLQNLQALKGQGSTRGASSRVQVVDSDATTEEPSDSEGNNF